LSGHLPPGTHRVKITTWSSNSKTNYELADTHCKYESLSYGIPTPPPMRDPSPHAGKGQAGRTEPPLPPPDGLRKAKRSWLRTNPFVSRPSRSLVNAGLGCDTPKIRTNPRGSRSVIAGSASPRVEYAEVDDSPAVAVWVAAQNKTPPPPPDQAMDDLAKRLERATVV